MIYLRDNPLLREPLRKQHVKPRLLGHWGASPALSLIYVHCNRLIKARDLDMIFIAGPGHGDKPAPIARRVRAHAHRPDPVGCATLPTFRPHVPHTVRRASPDRGMAIQPMF